MNKMFDSMRHDVYQQDTEIEDSLSSGSIENLFELQVFFESPNDMVEQNYKSFSFLFFFC
jgi:hypothetical protein